MDDLEPCIALCQPPQGCWDGKTLARQSVAACEQIVVVSHCVDTEKRKPKWQMSHCLREHGGKKRTTKTTWLVACLYSSWKASGTTKHINGLLWRWIGWTQTQTQIKTSRPRQSLHDLRLHLFLHWPHTFPSHPPKLSRLNPDLWVADSSMAWWPNCLPSCLSICRSLAVVKRNYSYLESCQDLTINSWSFFTLSFNFFNI